MKLDLRKPSFVLVGSWNPAIFQPSWLAHFALEVPEGQNVSGAEVVSLEPNTSSVCYLGNTGFSVSRQRADFFLNSISQDDIATIEKAILNIVNTLSHTPLGAYGINFTFVVDDPDDEVLDKLKSKDNIDQYFNITNQTFTSSIRLEEGLILNFSRKPSEGLVIFEFNYHHEKINQATFKDDMPGKYKEYIKKSLEILNTLYDLGDDYEVIKHTFNEAQQQNAGA